MFVEQRKHKRYKGKEGAFAAFLTPGEFINLGNIIDISMGGLCIRYLSTSGTRPDCTGMKIFGSNGRFIHVEKLECHIVYDDEIPDSALGQLSTRRCGVQFRNLNVRNKAMLQDFIEHFTYENSSPDQ
ncbi:MAG: PilZ domain-containing protein [Syntrophobacter sp.]